MLWQFALLASTQEGTVGDHVKCEALLLRLLEGVTCKLALTVSWKECHARSDHKKIRNGEIATAGCTTLQEGCRRSDATAMKSSPRLFPVTFLRAVALEGFGEPLFLLQVAVHGLVEARVSARLAGSSERRSSSEASAGFVRRI